MVNTAAINKNRFLILCAAKKGGRPAGNLPPHDPAGMIFCEQRI
jgi:hypothetical protein